MWSYAAGFMLFYVTLHLSVTAFMVYLRHDIQTIKYSEVGKMHITDPVRDLLAAFIGSCYTLIDYQIHIKTGRNMWFL